MGILAISYMVLNYLRFGSIVEFGHNYLPEFMRAENGQFHVSYIANNLKSLLQLPQYQEDGKMVINHFGNLNFLIVSPVIVMTLAGLLYAIVKKNREILLLGILIVLLSVGYLLFLTAHRTMGGWHFGNRYAIDILPYIYLLIGKITAKYPYLAKYYIPLCIWGICVNAIGTIVVYNGLA